MVDLYHRESGDGPPFVLLHGLFGSADNLGALARAFCDQFRVISLDLRDHGRSPHTDTINYPVMADDVAAKMADLGVEKAVVFGHSMGGKVAMQMAASAPDLIDRLIIGDIAPVAYQHNHVGVLAAQRAVEQALPNLKTRTEARSIMAPFIEEDGVLSFLMTNLRRGDQGWVWRHNLDLIDRAYCDIAAAPTRGQRFDRPVLFIKGANSDYILPEMEDAVRARFVKPAVKVIGGTGHWFHAEKPDMTHRLIKDFLEQPL